MRPLRTGPTHFFAVSPIWWQVLHTPNTFSPAAASWALTSPAPAIVKSATKTNPRILFSCFDSPLRDRKSLVLCREAADLTAKITGWSLSSAVHDQSSTDIGDPSLHVRSHGHDVLDSRQRHQAERGRKRIRFGSGRRNDTHRAVARRTAARRRIEQMRKAPRGVETKSRTRRCRDSTIDKVNGFGDYARPLGIGEADAPRRCPRALHRSPVSRPYSPESSTGPLCAAARRRGL